MNIFLKLFKGLFKTRKSTTPPVVTKPKVVVSKSDPYKEVFKRSPHQSGSITPKYIVLHDSEGSYIGGVSWIQDPVSKVSYHYLIDADGNRTQFVRNTRKAWHAGVSKWDGINGLNSHSIGVAFWGNTRKRHASDVEIDSCAHKCVYLMKKFGIKKRDIITHQMISPNRKTDTAPSTYKRVLERIDVILD
jgi:N-acetyl-anhydromuramyl-L-alanine amidase AmpD